MYASKSGDSNFLNNVLEAARRVQFLIIILTMISIPYYRNFKCMVKLGKARSKLLE